MKRVREAVAQAAAALAERRGEDGLWRDFRTLAGASCDWVTGFVVVATDRCQALREPASRTIRSLYYRQRPSGGWGYNCEVPPDCDSTAWVLLAAATAPRWRPSAIERAIHYIRRHWRSGAHGFATYAPEDRIDAYIEAPAELTGGWLSAHTCVSAVAVQALILHGLRDGIVRDAVGGLRSAQRPDGTWQSYWWPGFAYATYHALKGLAMAEALTGREWSRARDAVLQRQNPEGGWSDESGVASHAFATAMALLALLLRPETRTKVAISRGVDYLVDSCEDGVWPAAPILRIPAPMDPDPIGSGLWAVDAAGTNTVVSDVGQVFSSAAAVWALSLANAVLGSGTATRQFPGEPYSGLGADPPARAWVSLKARETSTA